MSVKTVIVYYSRSGTSRTFAQALQKKLGCDMDELTYPGNAKVSFLRATIQALRKMTAPFSGMTRAPAEYERVIFVTPVWGSGLSTPIRSYMAAHKEAVKSYALAAVCGGGGLSGTVKDARARLGKEPVAAVLYTASQIAKGNYDLEPFAKNS